MRPTPVMHIHVAFSNRLSPHHRKQCSSCSSFHSPLFLVSFHASGAFHLLAIPADSRRSRSDGDDSTSKSSSPQRKVTWTRRRSSAGVPPFLSSSVSLHPPPPSHPPPLPPWFFHMSDRQIGLTAIGLNGVLGGWENEMNVLWSQPLMF